MTAGSSALLLKSTQLKFGAITFFAKQHKGDTCGSNGLPLTPNSIIIIGRAQLLKTIRSPLLCEYLDVIRGKHERTIVVSQYCGTPLARRLEKEPVSIAQLKKIARQVLSGLSLLHSLKIVHRNLSNENILLQDHSEDVKLFNYGLYYMTDHGALVSFPVLDVLYTAPEVYLAGPNSRSADPKVDIWSVGVCLAELALNKTLWGSLKLGQRIRKILSLLQVGNSIFEKIAREHNCYQTFVDLPQDLKDLIDLCLNVCASKRPTCDELLRAPFFADSPIPEPKTASIFGEPFEVFTIQELYHWWQLTGGDVHQELKKQGLIRSSPPILSLPSLVLIEGALLGKERNPATLYDPRIVEMPLETLYQRFSHLSLPAFYPLIHSQSDIISNADPPAYDATGLPLVIKEKDPEYQFHRVILFRRLLHGYPFCQDAIVREAHKDIPPLLRGEVWAALLCVKANYATQYLRLDKYTHTTTDRQIEVDIPRCHQYNELLSSSEGHKKLKRILKAWVYKNTQYVYWQGLDSLTAPFLYLSFNDEAKAFACLSNFVPKFLHKFFLKDNSAVIEEYLAKFSQLIAFHDPELANHLRDINFYPQLFAIPWFLTLFSHVFPLYKILHLWDKLLLCDSSFPLHVGLSILTQLRDRLLTSGFNECILLFSDLPEVDIEKCVVLSMQTYEVTPRSITSREHENELYHKKSDLDIRGVKLDELKNELCARISARDVVNLVRNHPEKILLIDIRNPTLFVRCSVKGSVNIPFAGVSFSENVLDNLGTHSALLKAKKDKVTAVIGDCDTDLDRFPRFLVQCNLSRVCVLHGGFNVLLGVTPTVLKSGINS